MWKIVVRYGLDVGERAFNTQPRVGEIRRDSQLRAQLGYGDNINLLMNGVILPDDALLANGSTVTVETAANTKAEPALVV